jgi:hypothetical protein
MATMLDGESYLGRVMVRKLSQSGDVKLYLWPLRCLKSKMGGPTFGVDVKGEEIIRFDPHGPRGHWHKGGYDKLGAGGSHVNFPEGMVEIPEQISWSLEQIREQGRQMLAEVGYTEEVASIDDEMLKIALDDVVAHLKAEGDHRAEAIAQGVLAAD